MSVSVLRINQGLQWHCHRANETRTIMSLPLKPLKHFSYAYNSCFNPLVIIQPPLHQETL